MPSGPDPALTPSVAAVLAERLRPGATVAGLEPLTGGVVAFVTALTLRHHRDERVVVRRPAAPDDPTTVREHRVRQALVDTAVPVARPRFADDRCRLLPSPFAVMDFVDGTTEVADHQLDEALDHMADVLATLHALDPAGLDLPVLPQRTDPVSEVVDWADEPALVLRLRPPPPPPAPVLCHGDFWPGNLLWRDRRIVAVIDWEDAALGDPLSDVAGTRMELLWRYGDGPGDLGPAAMQRFTERYLSTSGHDPARQPWWDLYVATAALAHMGRWGLPADQVAHMERVSRGVRDRALSTLSEPSVPATAPIEPPP